MDPMDGGLSKKIQNSKRYKTVSIELLYPSSHVAGSILSKQSCAHTSCCLSHFCLILYGFPYLEIKSYYHDLVGTVKIHVSLTTKVLCACVLCPQFGSFPLRYVVEYWLSSLST